MPKGYTVPKEVIAETLEGRAVVLHLKTGRYFALNASGTRMWERLAAHGDSARTASEISSEYAVDRSVAEQDLAEFISELVARGLLIAVE